MSQWDRSLDDYVGYLASHQPSGVGCERVALRYLVLPPSRQIKNPLGQGSKEVLYYVVQGRPQLSYGERVVELSSGHAIGFPEGAMVEHTLTNHGTEEVHLLAAEEKSISQPQSLLPAAAIQIVYCPEEPAREPYHYPGDSESFGSGFRISDKLGLKGLGVWYERLPSGKRSAFPHAHTHEEEFVFVLKGEPTVWLNGFTKRFGAGDFAAFPPGTGIAHVLFNDTPEEVLYLCVGEAREFAEEKLTYPLNPLRCREGKLKGWYWSDAPTLPQGGAAARSTLDKTEHIRFRLCEENAAAEVLQLFQQSPTYFERVDGCTPTLASVRQALMDGPKIRSASYCKEFLIIERGEEAIGVLDLHANHPEEGVCYLGLLLLREDLFGKGLGKRCYELAEDYIHRALLCSRVKLGVSEANDVIAFWEKQGFTHNSKTYQWAGEAKTSLVREFEKRL